jgi:hypothetical protein
MIERGWLPGYVSVDAFASYQIVVGRSKIVRSCQRGHA